ncbi:hypothetical protein [Acinetobacter sp. YH16039]|nr:hypothetical protein [Acinetobacter sp. YH16039]
MYKVKARITPAGFKEYLLNDDKKVRLMVSGIRLQPKTDYVVGILDAN